MKTLALGSLRSVRAVADRHACSPSSRVLGVWLVEWADELAVWLGQLWLHLADSVSL